MLHFGIFGTSGIFEVLDIEWVTIVEVQCKVVNDLKLYYIRVKWHEAYMHMQDRYAQMLIIVQLFTGNLNCFFLSHITVIPIMLLLGHTSF